jgi:GR25 family glycosyltransferase involved in LPS biosynthesis
MNGIPPAVCISLDRRPDRWTNIKASAEIAGLPLERLSAVDAKGFEAHKHPAVSVGTAHNIYYGVRRSHYEIDTPGAVGASLSHFKAWTQAAQSGSPALIIFEDDAVIPPDFCARLQQVMAALPSTGGWDVIQFQLTDYGDGVTGCKPMAGESPWQVCTSLMGAYAYMVSREGARKLLDRAYPIELHVDAYMAYLSRLGHIRMLWHPLIDIPTPEMGSDINHGSSGILNVPTHMDRYGIVALETRTVIGLMALAALAGAAFAYRKK